MRFIYTILFYLLVPFVLLRLFWRGVKAPEYRKRWTERLAVYHKDYPNQVIWIHAVSVGEAEAVFPLVKRLQKQYRSTTVLITTTTATGSTRVQTVMADTVAHVYLPYDLPCVVKRFLTVFKPKIAIIMEKEIWPNLYAHCAKRHIPLMIINGRLSATSATGYKKIPALIKPALACVTWVATQTAEDRERFVEIGAIAACVSVTGNLKFDLELDDNIIQQGRYIKQNTFADRFVWIIASTHENEEDVFLDIYPVLKKKIPELLLMIAPRHPERFESVKKLTEKKRLKACMRSLRQPCTLDTDVYIADTMGELKLLFGSADICFIGGSMVPVGGHNILEPAAMNIPIMFGPHMVNFKEIANNMLDLNAAIACLDEEEIITTVQHLYGNSEYRCELVSNASIFLKKNLGATERIKQLIGQVLVKERV